MPTILSRLMRCILAPLALLAAGHVYAASTVTIGGSTAPVKNYTTLPPGAVSAGRNSCVDPTPVTIQYNNGFTNYCASYQSIETLGGFPQTTAIVVDGVNVKWAVDMTNTSDTYGTTGKIYTGYIYQNQLAFCWGTGCGLSTSLNPVSFATGQAYINDYGTVPSNASYAYGWVAPPSGWAFVWGPIRGTQVVQGQFVLYMVPHSSLPLDAAEIVNTAGIHAFVPGGQLQVTTDGVHESDFFQKFPSSWAVYDNRKSGAGIESGYHMRAMFQLSTHLDGEAQSVAGYPLPNLPALSGYGTGGAFRVSSGEGIPYGYVHFVSGGYDWVLPEIYLPTGYAVVNECKGTNCMDEMVPDGMKNTYAPYADMIIADNISGTCGVSCSSPGPGTHGDWPGLDYDSGNCTANCPNKINGQQGSDGWDYVDSSCFVSSQFVGFATGQAACVAGLQTHCQNDQLSDSCNYALQSSVSCGSSNSYDCSQVSVTEHEVYDNPNNLNQDLDSYYSGRYQEYQCLQGWVFNDSLSSPQCLVLVWDSH